jgi:hypothetical protein
LASDFLLFPDVLLLIDPIFTGFSMFWFSITQQICERRKGKWILGSDLPGDACVLGFWVLGD